jgi:hypothetical protein
MAFRSAGSVGWGGIASAGGLGLPCVAPPMAGDCHGFTSLRSLGPTGLARSAFASMSCQLVRKGRLRKRKIGGTYSGATLMRRRCDKSPDFEINRTRVMLRQSTGLLSNAGPASMSVGGTDDPRTNRLIADTAANTLNNAVKVAVAELQQPAPNNVLDEVIGFVAEWKRKHPKSISAQAGVTLRQAQEVDITPVEVDAGIDADDPRVEPGDEGGAAEAAG